MDAFHMALKCSHQAMLHGFIRQGRIFFLVYGFRDSFYLSEKKGQHP
jgi:hypothetical protein